VKVLYGDHKLGMVLGSQLLPLFLFKKIIIFYIDLLALLIIIIGGRLELVVAFHYPVLDICC
jgi:hypothetical protein